MWGKKSCDALVLSWVPEGFFPRKRNRTSGQQEGGALCLYPPLSHG